MPTPGEVICEKGRHVNCLHDRARKRSASGAASQSGKAGKK